MYMNMTLSTAYDISTSSYNVIVLVGIKQSNQSESLAFNSDGTKMFVCDSSRIDVYEYSLSTAFDITSASYSNIFKC